MRKNCSNENCLFLPFAFVVFALAKKKGNKRYFLIMLSAAFSILLFKLLRKMSAHSIFIVAERNINGISFLKSHVVVCEKQTKDIFGRNVCCEVSRAKERGWKGTNGAKAAPKWNMEYLNTLGKGTTNCGFINCYYSNFLAEKVSFNIISKKSFRKSSTPLLATKLV